MGPGVEQPAGQRSPRRLSRVYVVGVSVAIVVCLVWQMLAFVPDYHPAFPFLKYPMYANSATGTPRADVYTLTATLADGEVVDAGPEHTGLFFFAWNFDYVRKLRWGAGHEKCEAALDALVPRIETFYGRQVVEVHLETQIHEIIDGEIIESTEHATFVIKPEDPS